jgi:hypothetical protein
MAQALDYSAGFPGGLNIARPREAGRQKFIGAVRYIGLPDRRKCATRAELDDFSRTGLGMALVFEESSGNWRKGFQQGQYDARRARDHATAIGFPIGRPVYMAIDEDVVTAGEFSSMLEYLRGAQGPLGGSRLTGVYGEADVVDRARDAGVATWIWQTKAWSRGRVTTAHLRQLIGTVTVGGIACDVNDILTADWGQHNYVEDDMTPDQEQKLFIWLEDILRRVQQMHVADGAAIPDQAAPGVVPPWQAGGNYGGSTRFRPGWTVCLAASPPHTPSWTTSTP